MLYLHSKTNDMYRVDPGYLILIDHKGRVSVKAKHSGHSINNLTIEEFENYIDSGYHPFVTKMDRIKKITFIQQVEELNQELKDLFDKKEK